MEEPEREEPEEEGRVLREARATLSAVEAELSAIGQALDRLQAREYGRCEVCGADLPDELLAVQPAAGRCAAHLA